MLMLTSAALPQRLAAVAPSIQWLAWARQVGFCLRQPRKIQPGVFLWGLCLWALQPTASLRMAAACLGLCAGTTVSKQAVAKRFTRPAVAFVQQALGVVLARLAQRTAGLTPAVFAAFGRVLVQDSTTVALRPKLAAVFPGNANGRGPPLAVAKIQCVYELLAERFVSWRLTSFRVNDQAAARDILAVVRPGDLVLRDLGYFSLAVLRQLAERRAFFLSRLGLGLRVFTASGPQEFDLLGALERDGWLDVEVRLGAEEQLPVRLVAVAVADAVANERRRKARQNRDRRAPVSAKRLRLLGWDIFITNVGRAVWSAATVCRVYGVRWRIEIVFKSWKSHVRLEAVPDGDAAQVELLLWARLLVVTLLHGWLAVEAAGGHDPPLSLLKVMEFWAGWGVALLLGALAAELPQRWCEQVRYHCRYERRRKRFNFLEKLTMLG